MYVFIISTRQFDIEFLSSSYTMLQVVFLARLQLSETWTVSEGRQSSESIHYRGWIHVTMFIKYTLKIVSVTVLTSLYKDISLKQIFALWY